MVFVFDLIVKELLFKFCTEYLIEDLLVWWVLLLHEGIVCAHVQIKLSVNSFVEGGSCKISGLIHIYVFSDWTSYNNWFCPVLNYLRNISNHYWFSKLCASDDASNGFIWRFINFVKEKFISWFFIWSDGGTFYTYFMLFEGLASVVCYFVFCLASPLDTQIKLDQFDV